MKFLNKEPRQPIWLSTVNEVERLKDYTMEQKLGDIKMMANVQLSQEKEVAEFYRLDVQLRMYKLKEQNLSHERETFILKRIDNHIKTINQHISENANDNYWAWQDLEEKEG
tara:strand:- start:391 stop:726 length:336 start_codon:yes stop_codon:yes gene_type:complete